jgi:hypothetical protein
MTVHIKPNNKCNACQHYVDQHCGVRSVPRFCGKRYTPKDGLAATPNSPQDAAPPKKRSGRGE